MANNYTLTSFKLKLDTEQIAIAQLALLLIDDPEMEIENSYTAEDTQTARAIVQHYDSVQGCNDDENCFGTQWEDRADGIWFYSEESCDLDRLATFVQACLRVFELKRCEIIYWANTCSKPRLDEFGGGSICITPEDITWFGDYYAGCTKGYYDNNLRWYLAKYAADHLPPLGLTRSETCRFAGEGFPSLCLILVEQGVALPAAIEPIPIDVVAGIELGKALPTFTRKNAA